MKLGIEIEFSGNGIDEKGIVKSIDSKVLNNYGIDKPAINIGDVVIEIDPAYFRPTEVDLLIGNPVKAKKILNWVPKYNLEMLINEMVDSDMEIARIEKLTRK